MNVLHSSQNLVDEELDVVVRQLLSFDDVVQVGAHQRAHQVDISEVVERGARRENIHQVDDLLKLIKCFGQNYLGNVFK